MVDRAAKNSNYSKALGMKSLYKFLIKIGYLQFGGQSHYIHLWKITAF